MKFKSLIPAVALLAVPLAAPCGEATLTEKSGIRFTEGTLSLTLSYPQLPDAAGKRITPKVTPESPTLVRLDYGDGRTAEVRLGDGEGSISFTNRGGARPHLECNIPMNFGDGGKWSLGTKSGEFPKLPSDPPVLTAQNANRVSFTAPGGEMLTLAVPGWLQLQDNRKYKWNIYQLQIGANLSGDTWNFRWELRPPTEKVPPKVDAFGQLIKADFPEKVASVEELKADVEKDNEYYASLNPPERDTWGGMKEGAPVAEGTGFFRTADFNGRKVLLDPEGRLFFQLGVCSVGHCDDYTYVAGRENIYEFLPNPKGEFETAYLKSQPGTSLSFYIVNLIRKTGRPHDRDRWQREMVGRLRKWGFNSCGGFTGCTPVFRELNFPTTPMLPFGGYQNTPSGFPDPFDPVNAERMDARYKEFLAPLADLPDILGFFSDNERDYASVVPGVLRGGSTPAKKEFLARMQKKYGSFEAFAAVWQPKGGDWNAVESEGLIPSSDKAFEDQKEFADHFFDAWFGMIRRTMRKYDKNHLYLGERFLPAMTSYEPAMAACANYADVFSVNYYAQEPDPAFLENLGKKANKPLLLSEWSFGSASQGLFGVVNVADEEARGIAYRKYVENGAASPWVVGVQWFELLDQAVTGRFFQKYNGEAMNTGLLNVADRPYKKFLAHAMETNYRIYDFVLGKAEPVPLSAREAKRALLVQAPRILPGHNFDGSMTGWPNRPGDAIVRSVDGKTPDASQTGDFRCAWDDQNLYILVTMTDATPAVNPHSGKNLWLGDSAELFFGKELEPGGSYRFHDRQLIVGFASPGKWQWYNTQNGAPIRTALAVAADRKSARLEIAVPWSELGVAPETGMKMRFDIGLDFGQDNSTRSNQLMWNGDNSNNAVRDHWGTLVLIP